MHGTPRPAGPTRRAVLTGAVAGAAGLALAPVPALAGTGTGTGAEDPIVDWIDRTARPLRGVDPGLPAGDLAPLRAIVGGARVVGLGESAHTTYDEFALKHRVAADLVERLGFRTIAWEEAWASGVLIDRYVTTGAGDPAEIVGQTTFNLRNRALLDLMEWMRAYNAVRPPRAHVRFLGADVLQLREVQFTELERYVADVAPGRTATLLEHLDPLRIVGSPGRHQGNYMQLDAAEQQVLIRHAREVRRLVRHLPYGSSQVTRFDAEMHAFTLAGFYEANSREGDANDTRERYIVDVLDRWANRVPGRTIYSAANAHTVARPEVTASIPNPFAPPETWVATRSMAGGLLRARYGSAYTSVGITFDHGSILAGWQFNAPEPVTIAPPAAEFTDHPLGRARLGDYLLDLRGPAPAPVRRWLDGPGRLRIYSGSFYDPAIDSSFFMAANRWGRGFDALLHLGTVTAARLP